MESKYKKLIKCVVLDAIGMVSAAMPIIDVVWAPLAASISYKMFGEKRGKFTSIITFIEEILPRQKLDQLYQMSDAIVSLHRSEGLGYLCLEGMYFGKPVIATNWSGNIDFMDHDNSCLVDYDLIPVENSAGPYKIDHTDQIWAEAKVEHAAQYMKRLYEDKEYREKIEKNAYSSIRTKYTPEISGKQMQERIQYLEEHELYNKKSINTIKK